MRPLTRREWGGRKPAIVKPVCWNNQGPLQRANERSALIAGIGEKRTGAGLEYGVRKLNFEPKVQAIGWEMPQAEAIS